MASCYPGTTVEISSARAEIDGRPHAPSLLPQSLLPSGAVAIAIQHAQAALISAQRSFHELTDRRGGLIVLLGIIVLVLIVLAMKIRTLH